MSIILAIKSSHVAVVAADSQRVSPTGVSQAPYEKTFETNSLIGAHAGLLEFSGLDVKHHILNALGAKYLCPRDAVRTIELHMRPLLQAVADDEVSFEHRCLDIIVASRAHIASLRLCPNTELRQIEAQYNENQFWLVAGTDQAKDEAVRFLSGLKNAAHYGREKMRTLAKKAVEAAIVAGGQNPHHPSVASCSLPVSLRHIR
jgi:hypothetical protein